MQHALTLLLRLHSDFECTCDSSVRYGGNRDARGELGQNVLPHDLVFPPKPSATAVLYGDVYLGGAEGGTEVGLSEPSLGEQQIQLSAKTKGTV
jgi:hypothetical protein